jgi:hypothetical protein
MVRRLAPKLKKSGLTDMGERVLSPEGWVEIANVRDGRQNAPRHRRQTYGLGDF